MSQTPPADSAVTPPMLRVRLADENGTGAGTDLLVGVSPSGVPQLVWLGPDGAPIAQVVPDLLDGQFQFLVYGREQLEGNDGFAAVRFTAEGTVREVTAADFPEPVPVVG